MDTAHVNETARVMSSAIAPVFLISGIGVIMTAMTTRYGRVIDRVRAVLKECREAETKGPIPVAFNKELRALYKRARLLRTTIIMSSLSVFCVVLTIFFLFSNMMFDFRVPFAAEMTFELSLVFLIISIGLFIEDFAISLKILKLEVNTRVGSEVLQPPPKP